MPSGRKPRSKSPVIELDQSALAKLDEYRLDWRRACTELIRIRPRDKGFASKPVVNFTFRPAQEKAFTAIQKMRSFNIFRSLKREYPTNWQNALAAVIGINDIPETAAANVELILNARPEYVLHHLHKLGFVAASDSPVLMVIIKARQLGFSTLIQIILFLYAFFNERTAALVLSSDDESVEHVLSMTTTLIDEWPEELKALQPALVGEARDRIELHNKSKYMARTSDGKRIHSITADIIHATEYAHYVREDRVAAALVAAPSHAWIYYESTSAGPSGDYYDKAKSAITVEQLIANYDAKVPTPERQIIKVFVSWLEDPLYKAKNMEEWEVADLRSSLDDYERNLLARFPPGRFDALTGAPLPVCDLARLKWRREKIKNDCQRGKDRYGRLLEPSQYFCQEFPADEAEAFQEASGAVFPTETLLRMDTSAQSYPAPRMFRFRDEKSLPDPVTAEHLANLWVWSLPVPGHSYVVGADTGSGRGQDNTVIPVLDRLDGTMCEQVAEFSFPHLSEVATAHIAVMLARLYNNAFLVPEENGRGVAFIEEVVKHIQYTNVYFRQQFKKLGGISTDFSAYGFNTSNANKDLLIGQMKQAMIDDRLRVYSKHAIHEMRMFQFADPTNPKSPMKAREGEKDDRVIALALAYHGTLPQHGAPMLEALKRNEPNTPKLPDPGSTTTDGMTAYDLLILKKTNEMIVEADKLARGNKGRKRRLDRDNSFASISRGWN